MEYNKINNNEIEFVFENCECIHISTNAIKSIWMETKGERYEYDRHGILYKTKLVKSFCIEIYLKNELNFYHKPNQSDKTTFKEEGSAARDRLRYCDDICRLYINGEHFSMPWNPEKVIYDKDLPIPCYKNKWQENKEETLPDGTQVLTIKIKEGEK